MDKTRTAERPRPKSSTSGRSDAGQNAPAEKPERIAKVLARAGVCSRREAERMIEAGRVAVDGKLLAGPAVNVNPGAVITVDGKPVAEPEPSRLWCYHKPRGLLTSHRDPQGRETVFEKLPADLPRVISVGRLDYTSEGLLLLTNDGALARRLELPETGWTRRYRVRVHGTPDEARLARLGRGIEVEGIAYGPISAVVDSQEGAGSTFRVRLPPAIRSAKRELTTAPPASVARQRMLIVDDELTLLSSLRRALGRDLDVVLASSAAEAMLVLEQDDRFDVVLCDIMMPEVTGIELFERVSAAHPELRDRFIFMTGGAFSASTRQFIDSTEHPRLEKPFDVRELRRLLHRRAKAASGR